jgi:hypothetical protein
MSRRFLIPLAAVVAVMVPLGMACCILTAARQSGEKHDAAKARARDQGRRAALFMAPCYGNPYQGTESHIDESVEWCEGWIEGRKELEQRAND